jgi:hypothetical protein
MTNILGHKKGKVKMNTRNKVLCYLALPVFLLAASLIQPTRANAEVNSHGIDCSSIDVPSLLKEDNLGAGRILIACGIVRGGQPSAGGVIQPPSPPNINVSNGSDCSSSSDVCGSESMVAASTKDKGQTVVVNYNANYQSSNYSGTSYSTDGGATFTEIQPAPFASGHGENVGDPLVVFNSKLGLFFAGDLATGCGGQGIGLWTSPDGKTWTTGACPHNGEADDRPSMWADNVASSATYGRMYISFNNFSIGSGALSVVYSDDGVNWTGPVLVSNTGTFMRDVQITGSPRGAGGAQSTVFLASMDEGGGGNATRQNVMYNSTDGGATWTTVVMGPRFNPVGDSACPSNGYFWQVNPIIRHMGWGEPAVGPNGVVHYVFAGAGAKNGDKGDIFYTRSTDNGNTWSTPIKLNTDVDSAFHEQWMPSLSATSAGRITASWYDRRKSTSSCVNVGDPGCNYERVGRQSTTNGASWQAAEITISTGIITQPSQNDPDVVGCYAGDYDYSTALNAADLGGKAAAYVTWTDGRHSISGVPVQSVDFAKVSEP